jgi:hypothetical protein
VGGIRDRIKFLICVKKQISISAKFLNEYTVIETVTILSYAEYICVVNEN